jgi:hypothetical protein
MSERGWTPMKKITSRRLPRAVGYRCDWGSYQKFQDEFGGNDLVPGLSAIKSEPASTDATSTNDNFLADDEDDLSFLDAS